MIVKIDYFKDVNAVLIEDIDWGWVGQCKVDNWMSTDYIERHSECLTGGGAGSAYYRSRHKQLGFAARILFTMDDSTNFFLMLKFRCNYRQVATLIINSDKLDGAITDAGKYCWIK